MVYSPGERARVGEKRSGRHRNGDQTPSRPPPAHFHPTHTHTQQRQTRKDKKKRVGKRTTWKKKDLPTHPHPTNSAIAAVCFNLLFSRFFVSFFFFQCPPTDKARGTPTHSHGERPIHKTREGRGRARTGDQGRDRERDRENGRAEKEEERRFPLTQGLICARKPSEQTHAHHPPASQPNKRYPIQQRRVGGEGKGHWLLRQRQQPQAHPTQPDQPTNQPQNPRP